MSDDGNESQSRAIAKQLFSVWKEEEEARLRRATVAEIPSPLKWAGGIVAALFTLGAGGTATWVVNTVNETQITVARIDERMESQNSTQSSNLDEINRRLGRLEAYHSQGEMR